MAIPTGSQVISTAKKYVRRASYGWCNRFTKWYGFGNQSVAWCGCFVYYVLCKSGAKSLTAGCPNFAYVPAIHDWAKAKGYVTKNPKKGDIIIFDWGHDGTRDHVGFFISKAGSGLVNTVEGNTSSVSASNGGCVQLKVRRTYDILAYIHLPYAKSSSSSKSKSSTAKKTATKTNPAYPTATIWYGSSNNKTQVKRLQKCMNKILGTKLTVDGIYGVQSLAAVKRFQKKYGLTVDGIVGPSTRSKIKKVLAKKK